MEDRQDKEKRERRFKNNRKNYIDFREKKEKTSRNNKLKEEFLEDKIMNKYKKFFDIEVIEDTEDEDIFFSD